MIIDDGSGNGKSAKVNANKRLHIHAISELNEIYACDKGLAYNINTGLISISANGTLLYFKNNETLDFIVSAIAIGSFEGITHSDDPYITIVRNPTGGDLISDASAVSMNQNRNFGSSLSLSDSLAYKGKSSGTLTGGDDIAILQVTPGGRSYYSINMILPKGTSMGIKLTANVTTGSANYYAAIIGYLDEEAGKDDN